MLRGVILALVIVSGLSVGLLAQQPTVDPILGTWTLNVQRSRFPRTDVSAPKGHVEVYRRVADRIERTSTRPAPDGSSSVTRVTWPTEGGFAVYEQGQVPQGRTIIEALISSGDMTQIIRGVDTQGKPFEQLNVYDRQE